MVHPQGWTSLLRADLGAPEAARDRETLAGGGAGGGAAAELPRAASSAAGRRSPRAALPVRAGTAPAAQADSGASGSARLAGGGVQRPGPAALPARRAAAPGTRGAPRSAAACCREVIGS